MHYRAKVHVKNNLTPVLICPASSAHYSAIKEIVNYQFGTNYIAVKKPLQKYTIVLVALLKDQVVGFCIGKIEGKIGVLDLMAVKPSYQKQGIGTALFNARMVSFQKLKVNQLKLYHWVTKQFPIPKIAIKNGFIQIQNLPNYWAKESLQLNYDCSECGQPPCACHCLVYETKRSKK